MDYFCSFEPSPHREGNRTHLLEYSLNVASVVSIGHISTVALAACSLGNMTAGVTGFSIVQGFASALDTLLPSAWTSGNSQLVGLWLQRMLFLVTLLLFVSSLLFSPLYYEGAELMSVRMCAANLGVMVQCRTFVISTQAGPRSREACRFIS